jgi:hypothetical protein
MRSDTPPTRVAARRFRAQSGTINEHDVTVASAAHELG